MDPKEKEIRLKIATEINANMLAALENCACLGREALQVGPNKMTTTYVERMHSMLTRNIINGNLVR